MVASFDVVSPIETLLPKWFDMIQKWASDGSLRKAIEAIVIRNPKDSQVKTLTELLDQWSGGSFKSLPAVELVTASSINDHPVCYDRVLNKIVLSKNWSAAVSVESILKVLATF
jgi:hypothetical protein